ncbi:hypothetical protein CEXT_608441 [Caerostris extrusa]|uniref:Uncharacterized protein n=1 Tax=Caerostris extrusa TaxID=172846 RepID=A0AAV4R7D2_CAEEX|nr:hypothetical protein CEXT_608441 [Caerostris extrusa]
MTTASRNSAFPQKKIERKNKKWNLLTNTKCLTNVYATCSGNSNTHKHTHKKKEQNSFLQGRVTLVEANEFDTPRDSTESKQLPVARGVVPEDSSAASI